jgi:bifunctional UDP-N-acetylglucosamine pyrophosphorylase/glucosamine-1-phosphate N-acetyltransferase
VQLAAADRLMRTRINEAHMLAGVTIVDPATTYIEPGVRIGQDTTIYPNTHLRGATTIGAQCLIGPDAEVLDTTIADGAHVTRSVVEGARIGQGCRIGPFAHLRQGTVLEDGVQIGNYAEVKNSTIGAGTVSHHVSYIGDTTVGARVNVGAGSITANYDGLRKHRTVIGDDVFVGCDTILRAPVTLGNGSHTGAGAVVLHDVAPGTTVVGVPARVKVVSRQ